MGDRPGIRVFLGGVAFVLASTALGFYLSHQSEARESSPVVFLNGEYPVRQDAYLSGKEPDFLHSVNAMMWMTFGLGACLTMVGLRMIVRPDLTGRSLPPLRPVREVFENPE